MCHVVVSLNLSVCGECFRLFDPAFFFDLAFERNCFVKFGNIGVGPTSDLCKTCNATGDQFFLERGANTSQLFQIIRTGSNFRRCFNLGSSFRRSLRFRCRLSSRFRNRSNSRANRTSTNRSFDAGFFSAFGQNLCNFDNCQLLTVTFFTLRRVLTYPLNA